MKILIVDDEKMVQKAVISLGKKLDIEVEAVADGKDAISLCSAGNLYDLILMDKSMEEVSGIDATKAIRGLSNGSSYIIYLVTADECDDNEWKSFGFDGFFLKPINKSNFEALVNKYKK
jgi:CheY-like chemotaxis protein